MVEIKNLSLDYSFSRKKKIPALAGLNACFNEGEFSVIIGPSGSGKTSLIRILSGLLKPGTGEVSVRGIPVKGIMKNCAVIFQDFGLLPWKTVRANAELPLRFAGRAAGGRYGTVDLLLKKFGLAEFAGSYPRELSGGMKQRLAIVRALAAGPELLLMDEPFSSLDAFTREEAQDFFLSIKNNLSLTVIMVSHSIEEAVYLGDAVYVMSGRNPGILTGRVVISRNNESSGGFRESPGFQEYCGLLRKMMKGPLDCGQNIRSYGP